MEKKIALVSTLSYSPCYKLFLNIFTFAGFLIFRGGFGMEQANFTTAEHHRNSFRIIMKWTGLKRSKQNVEFFPGYTTEKAAQYGVVLLKNHISSWTGSRQHCLSSFPIERDLEGPPIQIERDLESSPISKKTGRSDGLDEGRKRGKQFHAFQLIKKSARRNDTSNIRTL